MMKTTELSPEEYLGICNELSSLPEDQAKDAIAKLLAEQSFKINGDVVAPDSYKNSLRILLPASGTSLNISGCKNVKHIPAMAMSGTIRADNSGVEDIDPDLETKELYAQYTDLKHLPAIKARKIYLSDSNLDSIDPNLVTEELYAQDTPLKHLPAIKAREIVLDGSQLDSIDPNLETEELGATHTPLKHLPAIKAREIDLLGSQLDSIDPDLETKELYAQYTDLKHLPSIKARKIVLDGSLLDSIDPNLVTEELYAQDTPLKHLPAIKARKIDLDGSQLITVDPMVDRSIVRGVNWDHVAVLNPPTVTLSSPLEKAAGAKSPDVRHHLP